MTESGSRIRGREIGITGETLAANLKRIRGQASLRELESRLDELGTRISASGLQKIEAGTRRVDVDELMALSIALGVTPITLLVPNADSSTDLVSVTGLPSEIEASELWDWLRAEVVLGGPGQPEHEWLTIGNLMMMMPDWEKKEHSRRILVNVEEMRAKRRQELERLREGEPSNGDDRVL